MSPPHGETGKERRSCLDAQQVREKPHRGRSPASQRRDLSDHTPPPPWFHLRGLRAQAKEPGVGPWTSRWGFHGVANCCVAFPDLSWPRSDLHQAPCGLMQMIPSHILELKAASTEIHRNGDVLSQENHTPLRSSQKRQRCPLQSHL